MERIEAVLVDVGGVLIVPNGEIVAAALARVGVTIDPALADLAHAVGTAALDALPSEWSDWGSYHTAYALTMGVRPDQLRVALPALRAVFTGPSTGVWAEVRPGAVDGLARLAATGVPFAIVSNSDGTVAQQLVDAGLCQAGPGPHTQAVAVLDSAVVGTAKPDPAIFSMACEALGVDPAAAVHVGDTVHADVVGAEAAGVRPVHFDPHGLCADEGHAHAADLDAVAALVRRSRS